MEPGPAAVIQSFDRAQEIDYNVRVMAGRTRCPGRPYPYNLGQQRTTIMAEIETRSFVPFRRRPHEVAVAYDMYCDVCDQWFESRDVMYLCTEHPDDNLVGLHMCISCAIDNGAPLSQEDGAE